MFKLLQSENGFVHVCGHRGNSIASPENTLAALTATRDSGGTSAEIDVMLTADHEIVLMHDDFLDRTTNGKGLVSNATLAEIKSLDAGSWFGKQFAGERVPTLAEALAYAQSIGIGLVTEIKEFQNVEPLLDKLAETAESMGALEHAIFISFDHTVLTKLKQRNPAFRTEGILHARHVDVAQLAKTANLDSVSIEHMMFRPEDGQALHDAGVAVRMHLMRPEEYALYREHGVDLLQDVPHWVEQGVIDTISGDDVSFLAGFLP